MQKAIAKPIDATQWNALSPQFLDLNYRQQWNYAHAAALHVGAEFEAVAIYFGNEVIGLAMVRIKRLSKFGFAYINGGPVCRKSSTLDKGNLRMCIQALRDKYVNNDKLCLRFISPIGLTDENKMRHEVLLACSAQFNRQLPTYQTILKELQSPEELRSSLNKKWRSELVRSERTPLTIKRATGLDAFDDFKELFSELIAKKNFKIDHDVGFYRSIQKQKSTQDKYLIHLAYDDNELVAGHLGDYSGDTVVYLLGASNDKGRKLRAAYQLHFMIMQYAHQQGFRYYDLGGIDKNENPGGYTFKSRFNGTEVVSAGPFDFYPSTLSRIILYFAEAAIRLKKSIRLFMSKQNKK